MKRVNKGFILTLIVLVSLTLYILKVETQRTADKEEIKKVYEEFIELTDKYSVLPEDLQKIDETVDKDRLEEYKKQMKMDLRKLMIDDEETINIQYKSLETALDSGYNKLEIRTNQKRNINKITTYRFNSNKVDIKFEGTLERNIKFYNGAEEKTESKEFDTIYDEIVLQKIDGKWKVKYSNLHYVKMYSVNENEARDTMF